MFALVVQTARLADERCRVAVHNTPKFQVQVVEAVVENRIAVINPAIAEPSECSRKRGAAQERRSEVVVVRRATHDLAKVPSNVLDGAEISTRSVCNVGGTSKKLVVRIVEIQSARAHAIIESLRG